MPQPPAGLATRMSAGAILAPLLLVVAVAASHGVGLRNGFVWDDHSIIVDNPDTRDLSRIGRVFLSPDLRPPYYRPLNRASYLVDHAIFGMNPAGFHAVNLLLQVGATLVLYLLALGLSLGRAGALTAALLLAVHPVGVEVVGFVTARNNLLALLFSLSALLLFGRAERRDSLGWASASGFAFLLALLSKEPAVMVLPVAAAWVVLPELRSRRPGVRSLALLAPLLTALAAYLVLRTVSLGALVGAGEARGALAGGWGHRLALNYYAIPRYLVLLAFPRDLTTYHVFPEAPIHTLLWPAAVWLAVLAVLACLVRRRSAATAVGLLWFGLGLLPISNLVSIPTATVIAERYLFIPAAGLWLLVGAGVDHLWRRPAARLPVGVAVAVVAVLLGARTYARTLDWRDDLSLDRAAVAVEPRAATARLNLGSSLLGAGDVPGAWREWREAARLDPLDPAPWTAMGLQAQRDGDLANAESMLRRAIQIAPGFVGANLGLASLLDQRGQSDAARTHWEAALSTEPENTTALVQLGTYWASRGDLARAERLLRAALDFDPHGSEAMFDLGKLSEMMGRRAEALAWYRRFVAEPGADPAAARTALERIRLLEGGAR